MIQAVFSHDVVIFMVLMITMKRILAAALLCVFSTGSFAASGTNSKEYKAAYECATESFKDEYGSGPVTYCVGNSRNPSKIEMKAYADAERDFRNKKTAGHGCAFGYATWVANGSHADGFEEGTVRETSLRKIAAILPGREDRIMFYDKNGNGIAVPTIRSWFVVSTKNGSNSYRVSEQAKNTCTRKQIG